MLEIRSEHPSTYNVLGGEIIEGASVTHGDPIPKTLQETAGSVTLHRVVSFLMGTTDSALPPVLSNGPRACNL